MRRGSADDNLVNTFIIENVKHFGGSAENIEHGILSKFDFILHIIPIEILAMSK